MHAHMHARARVHRHPSSIIIIERRNVWHYSRSGSLLLRRVCYAPIACTSPTRLSTGVAVHVLCELWHYCAWSFQLAEHRCGLPVLLAFSVTVQRHGVSLLRAPCFVAVLVLQSTSRGFNPRLLPRPGNVLALPFSRFLLCKICSFMSKLLRRLYNISIDFNKSTFPFYFPIMRQYLFNFSIVNESILMVLLCLNCQT